METRTVKISMSSKKIAYLLLAVGALLVFAWLVAGDDKSKNTRKKQKEFVEPLDLGVADPGMEGRAGGFVVLNAKAGYDTYAKIDGGNSLKISFSAEPIASAKIPDYFNDIGAGNSYRFGFWAKSDSGADKQITVRLAEKEKIRDLGKFSLNRSDDVRYFEFNFQADNDFEDLIFTSSDATAANVWIDGVSAEKLDVDPVDGLENIRPTVFGNTTWKNVDQSRDGADADSEDFFAKPGRRIGQIFQPARDMLSGVAFRILRHGTGGVGTYILQLREFDPQLGIISDEISASALINHSPRPEISAEMKEKEQKMREAFLKNEETVKKDFLRAEQDIKAGKIKDETDYHYPQTFTQDRIDAAKTARRAAQNDAQAALRAAQLEEDIKDMKESFNAVEEISIPLAARLDPQKQYWIGIDNSGVQVDDKNHLSIAQTGADGEAVGGFSSEIAGIWKNSPALWFKTFYPIHAKVNGGDILTGATISDMGGGKLVYRYRFADTDSTSMSGFSGRKIYDMLDGSFKSDMYGNYNLSDYADYALYRFDTVHAVKKITIRDVMYHTSLALEISTDKENWEEVFSDDPEEGSQAVDPIVYAPEEKSDVFYLRIRPAGNQSVPFRLSIEAELEKS